MSHPQTDILLRASARLDGRPIYTRDRRKEANRESRQEWLDIAWIAVAIAAAIGLSTIVWIALLP